MGHPSPGEDDASGFHGGHAKGCELSGPSGIVGSLRSCLLLVLRLLHAVFSLVRMVLLVMVPSYGTWSRYASS